MSAESARFRSAAAALFADRANRDPEARLLNMRELRAIRDAHAPAFDFASSYDAATGKAQHLGKCSCGHPFPPARTLAAAFDAIDRHLGDVIEFSKGRKVAEARANVERDRQWALVLVDAL